MFHKKKRKHLNSAQNREQDFSFSESENEGIKKVCKRTLKIPN